jgi:hypothetical protein
MTLAYELQQDRARQANDEIDAPPCPGCGRPVRDENWQAHRRLAHGLDGVQPYGRPDAREALFIGEDQAELDRKIARWREGHPGVRLLPMGDGRDRELGLIFARFRLIDRRGRRAT